MLPNSSGGSHIRADPQPGRPSARLPLAIVLKAAGNDPLGLQFSPEFAGSGTVEVPMQRVGTKAVGPAPEWRRASAAKDRA